jgi:UDP-N-acetylglucosamine 1-carboxyvinyltransferase
MRAFGASVEDAEGYKRIFIPEHGMELDSPQGCGIKVQVNAYSFPKMSFGATINAILAAVMRDGEVTYLSNCVIEPELLNLCDCLHTMGAKIKLHPQAQEMRIIGVKSLEGTTHRVLPDRIEAGTFMITAAATRGNMTLLNIEDPRILVGSLGDLLSEVGSIISYGDNYIQINHSDSNPLSYQLLTHEIQTPAFPTDLQSQMLALLSGLDGISNFRIVEIIWENRFKTVPELQKMGADIEVIGPKEVVVKKGRKLHGATVVAGDLRNAAALCIAGLSTAKGDVTLVKNAHHLDRGYALFEEKLQGCGAQIERVHSTAAIKDDHCSLTQSCSTRLLF